MRELDKAKAELARREALRPRGLTADERSCLLALGADLLKVWNAPTTTIRDKKELLRIVLEEVIITSTKNNTAPILRRAGVAATSTKLMSICHAAKLPYALMKTPYSFMECQARERKGKAGPASLRRWFRVRQRSIEYGTYASRREPCICMVHHPHLRPARHTRRRGCYGHPVNTVYVIAR